jgi:peptidoglycan/LPS O-acetylase OafA/YrhL
MPPAKLGHDYVPAFDGFRAICIAGVILVHVGPTSAPWFEALRDRGWFGVDAFFVLSGFLISSILLRELARDDTINLPRFYLRRALRLQPAYGSALVLMLLSGYLLDRDYFRTMVPAWPYFLTYTLNLAVAFAVINPPALITVSWSLCIEEQFYLLWPWVLRRVGAGRTLQFLLWALSGFAVYRATLYWWLTRGHFLAPSAPAVNRIAFGTDTRIDTILYGCALAVAIRADVPAALWAALRRSSMFPTLVVAAAALTIWWLNDPRFFRYGAIGPALAGVTFAMVIAALVLQPQSWPSRALSWRPLVFIGKVSYGVYLFHLLVISALAHLLHAPYGTVLSLPTELVEVALAFALSVLVAWVHYRLVEARAMAWREKIGRSASPRHAPPAEFDVAGEADLATGVETT